MALVNKTMIVQTVGGLEAESDGEDSSEFFEGHSCYERDEEKNKMS